jgi:hypothetical protein
MAGKGKYNFSRVAVFIPIHYLYYIYTILNHNHPRFQDTGLWILRIGMVKSFFDIYETRRKPLGKALNRSLHTNQQSLRRRCRVSDVFNSSADA